MSEPARPRPVPAPAPRADMPEPRVDAPAPRGPVPRDPAPGGSAAHGAEAVNDTGMPASAFGLLPDCGGFVARLGPGLRLGAEFLTGKPVSLDAVPQPLPGVRFATAQWRDRTVTLDGSLAVPHVATGSFVVRVKADGTPSIHGELKRSLALPALGNPVLTLALAEDGSLSGTATVEGVNLVPRTLRQNATATGSANLALANGRVSGDGTIEITYRNLGSGTVGFRFAEDGRFAAEGAIRITPPLLDAVSATVSVDEEGNLRGSATIEVGALKTPVAGLTLVDGTVVVGYDNGVVTGQLSGLSASYAGLGTITIAEAAVDKAGQLSGSGEFGFAIPGLKSVTGQVHVRAGRISGSVTLAADAFPQGLPVRRPSITATYTDGRLAVAGSAAVDLGPAGGGTFQASWSEAGVFAFGADMTLAIPGLNAAKVRVDYANGAISGDARIPVNTALLPGLNGVVTVRYAEDRWSGETTLAYSTDNGKLSGSITVTVEQTERKTLRIGGSGTVTAQIAPRLRGTLTATIMPEGAVDVSGKIEVTEPLELFPEKRTDKELFSSSRNIPLWAILVAVIRIRAGVRAGVGPGVLRNITVEGSYTIGADKADPSLSISGELYIPAFVEGYLSFGAGLGLDVVLGDLTGGIEAVGTAGVYGAICVVPELTYTDGDWGIEGTGTLAAGARLKLGLKAWAEIEALWVTVWEEEWTLAEHVMPVGPDLTLQAKMNYKFGSPQPPDIEFSSTDIDAESLIQGAMPKDGPPASGAREALANKAEWKGALKEQRAAPVPPEAAARAQAAEKPPEPKTQKPQHSAPPPGTAPSGAGQPGAAKPAAGAPGLTPPNEPARSAAADKAAKPDGSIPDTVPSDKVPNANQSRYPRPVTLDTLAEPPAPLPRTAQQEQEDVNAAAKTVELASKAATDSDGLDNFFPKIKERFRLTSLGYVGDFQKGFQIVGKINPEFSFKPDEPLSGTGIPGDLQGGHITKIALRGQDLQGAGEAGVGMEAWPLGPDHPQGSGPTGQDKLMGLLPVNPELYKAADQRYIRGHLLNDNLGGPGQPVNLFPITAQANSRHHSAIESHAKEWVNDKRYWIRYSVQILNIGPFKPVGPDKQSIDAEIHAKASVIDTELEPIARLTREVTIASTYNVGDAETVKPLQTEDKALLAAQQARPIDEAVDVKLSSRHHDKVQVFEPKMFGDISAGIAKHGSLPAVVDRLTTFHGFGDASGRVLTEAYTMAVAAGGPGTQLALDVTDRAIFTRITNLWGQGLADVL